MKQSLKTIFESTRLVLVGLFTTSTGLICLLMAALIFQTMLIVGMYMKTIEITDGFRVHQREWLEERSNYEKKILELYSKIPKEWEVDDAK